MSLVNDLLSLEVFAAGKVDEAFDTLFSGPAKPTAPMEINMDKLRKMVTTKLPKTSFDDTMLNSFIDFVAYIPHTYCFSKIHFVAAMRYLIVCHKPHLGEWFQNKLPGQVGAAGAGAPMVA